MAAIFSLSNILGYCNFAQSMIAGLHILTLRLIPFLFCFSFTPPGYCPEFFSVD